MVTMRTMVRRGLVETADGQIHFRIAGSGSPVILLHQTPRSSDEYLDVIPILAQTKQVITLDILGYGDSDKLPRPYRIEELARTIPVVLDALEIERASFAGQHFGALIAVEIAASFSERVDKLVLFHVFEMNATARQELLSLRSWYVQEDGSHLVKMWQWVMARTRDPLVAHRFVMDILKAGESNQRGHWAAAEYQPEKKWGFVKCPTLLVWGAKELKRLDDRGWNTSHSLQRIPAAIPNSKVVVVPDVGILFPNEAPGQFAELILGFLGNAG